MASSFKEDVSKGVREHIESNTGIVGEAIRERRRQAERQQKTQKEVAEINKVTAKIKVSGATLTNMEKAFTQISENLQLVAKAMKAQTTTFEQTQADYKPIEKQKKQNNPIQKAMVPVVDNQEELSLFDKVSNLMDGFEKMRNMKKAVTTIRAASAAKGLIKTGQAAEKVVGKTVAKSVIKATARKTLLKSLGKLVGKSIPIVGAAAGVGFAVGRLMEGDWAGAGLEVVSGLGGPVTSIPATIAAAVRDVYFDTYGVYPENDPLSSSRLKEVQEAVGEEASDVLKGSVDVKKAEPTPKAKPAPATRTISTAGGGRGGQGGAPMPEREQTEAEKVRSKLTPSQIAWLGDADPTDPYVMARMPGPAPGEQGGPSLVPSTPQPVGAPSPAAKPVTAAPAPPSTLAAPPPAAAAGAPAVGVKPPTSVGGGEIAMEQALKEQGFDPVAIAAIMAQTSHESLNFKVLQENLNYSVANLKSVFGKYFNNDTANQYANQPEKIANKVYANRMGNGPEESGDGFKYRGRGFIQLTGKLNYAAAGQALGLNLVGNPDLASDPKNAANIAVWFFKRNIKRITNWADTTNITKVVNGGLIGLADREAQFKKYLAKYTGGATLAGGPDASAGKEVAMQSTQVAAAKQVQQPTGTTIIAINNNTQTKMGTVNRPPPSQLTTTVGA